MNTKTTTQKAAKKRSASNAHDECSIIKTRDFNMAVRPQDDFYEYVNGGWVTRTSIPKIEMRWGSFYILRDENRKRLHALVERVAKDTRAQNGSDTQKVRDLYRLGMDQKRLNREGIKPVLPYMEMIEGIETRDDLLSVLIDLHPKGVMVPWTAYIDQDEKNSKKYMLRIRQGGLGMPDRDYYIKTDADSKRIKRAYEKHVGNMLVLSGLKRSVARDEVAKILKLETALARASMTSVELRDVYAQYNKMKVGALAKLAPSIDWKRYLQETGVGARELVVDQPKFIEELEKQFAKTSLDVWKVYLRWHVMSAFAGVLSDEVYKESFDFYGKTVSGLKEIRPRWQRVTGMIDSVLGEALGKIYVKEYFPACAKKRVERMVADLTAAYEARIKEASWMSSATRKKALEKLRRVVPKLGYPAKWRSYRALTIDPKKSYAENLTAAEVFEWRYEMGKLDKPVDRNEWFISPPTVNAFYNPNFNTICFPAGILQLPFFDADQDDALNYGAMGAIIGHELTHGFDDKGSLFDGGGNLKNWWRKEDRARFDAQGKRLVRQYNQFEVLPKVFVNGELTLGENIADLGGLVMAYYALKKKIARNGGTKKKGFTPEQRFFIGAAIAERGKYRDEYVRLVNRVDPHAPAKSRVNIPLSNMEEFYDAFGVEVGDGMYRAETDRVVIW